SCRKVVAVFPTPVPGCLGIVARPWESITRLGIIEDGSPARGWRLRAWLTRYRMLSSVPLWHAESDRHSPFHRPFWSWLIRPLPNLARWTPGTKVRFGCTTDARARQSIPEPTEGDPDEHESHFLQFRQRTG